jgi:hypothetical protein
MANHQRDAAKEQFWRRAIAGWQASGLGIRGYCRQQHLSEPSFWAWRRELLRRDQEVQQRAETQGRRGLPRSRRPVDARPRSAFVPVQVMADSDASAAWGSSAAVEIILGGGRVLRVRPGFDRTTLAEVMVLLEGQRC